MPSLVPTNKSRARSRTEGNKETHVKNYTLNITKALYKKLEATKRNLSIEYKHTAGGIVLTADAVTFELLLLATLNYFENLPEIKGQANIRKITDESQTTIATRQPTSKSPGQQRPCRRKKMNEQLNTDSNETCTKCNKKCRTRSTYCDTGNHWVHYKCQKLTQQEIQIAENSNGEDYYECKLCCEAKSSLLALKRCAQSNTHAQQLLEEETELLKVCIIDETSTNRQPEENYAVCDTMLMDPAWDICEDCNNNCHIKCMTEINGTYICIPCIILQEELKQQENINKDLAIVTPHMNIEGKNQETTLLNEESTPLATTKPIPKPRKPKMKQ
ncbi:MLL4 [Mytilus coruscus]|uniref:MLL4 n=1 Tax=Mytilus coruscus TaxID=42192 RepID=A0A6J8CX79_MYTCO|nr:MLL4 [Mytilus coruscus]